MKNGTEKREKKREKDKRSILKKMSAVILW